MNIEEIAQNYLAAFQNRDINSLGDFFSDSATLTDWDQTAEGKDEIIAANKKIFSSFENISLVVTNVVSSSCDVALECDLVLQDRNEETRLLVVDFITFDESGKIVSLRAYRGN